MNIMRSFFWLPIKVKLKGINVNICFGWNVTATYNSLTVLKQNNMQGMYMYWYALWHSLFVIQCSAGRRRLRNKLCRTELTEGLWTSWRTKRWDWKKERKKTTITYHTVNLILQYLKFANRFSFLSTLKIPTHTAACCYCYLYGIPSRFTHILQMKRFMRGFVVPLLQFIWKAPC